MKSLSGVVLRGLLLLALVLTGSPLAGQSTIASQGLGVPVEPQDARSRGLGGAAIGFAEPEISWANPASVAGLLVPGMVVSYQYDSFSVDGASGPGGSTARIPLLLAAFPAGQRVVFQAGFGGFLDQNWSFERPDTLLLGSDTMQVLDVVSSSGGINRLRFAATYMISPGLGIAAGLDGYTGGVDRIQRRLFASAATPECCSASWSYRGIGYTAGVQWSPTEATGVGASLSYGGEVEAIPRDDSDAAAGSYDLPLQLRIGGSGRVGEATVVALAASWSGWSSLNDALGPEGGARDAWSLNAGVEYDGLTVRERQVPLRLGARTATLPFVVGSTGAGEQAAERALSAGLGAVFGGGAMRTDTSFEFGRRNGGSVGIDESFWRFGLSVRVFGR